MKHLPITLIIGALLLGGCSEDKIYIDCGCNQPGTGAGTGTATTSRMSFFASVESLAITRAISPIDKDVLVHIYAFDAATNLLSTPPVDQGDYISLAPGSLTGVNGFKMNLPLGAYNFYGISDNSSFPAPSFTNGVSEPLYNGVDYLWWSGPKQEVISSQTSIPVLFFHQATQVVFEISAGENIELNELVRAHIYPSAEGAPMNLSTGEITPATGYMTQLSKMGVNGFTAQYIMLPVKTDVPLSVSFDIRVNGATTAQTFDVQVPVPDGAFKGGNSYRFKAVINASSVELPAVNVAHWTDVDETGNPLYPTAP